MAKYTKFFLSKLAERIIEDDLYNMNRMPCEAEHLVSDVDLLIGIKLVTVGKKYIFFGPTVYRRTELADALSEYIYGLND